MQYKKTFTMSKLAIHKQNITNQKTNSTKNEAFEKFWNESVNVKIVGNGKKIQKELVITRTPQFINEFSNELDQLG